MKKYHRYKEYFVTACHHVYNRGVNKEPIFRDNQDYEYFLRRLRYYKNKYKIEILSYCLMPNHFHLETKQLTESPLSKMVQFLANGYVMYFNHKYKRSGYLFEGKFRAILIPDDWYLLHLSRYIHLNPLIGKLVKNLQDWVWSSYLDYVSQRKGTLCQKNEILKSMGPLDYERFVDEDIERMMVSKEYEKLRRVLID